MCKILIIDDEPQIRRFLRIGLGSQGYATTEAETGQKGIEAVALDNPQLLILDLGLPDMDGMDVLKTVRDFYEGPIVILSVRSRESEKVTALDNGANDYVVKPFGIQELLARIRVLLRAAGENSSTPSNYKDEALELDVLNHRTLLDGQQIRLSRKEFRLLQLLTQAPDRVITQGQLIKQIWGNSHLEDIHYLRILVRKLREKLNDNPGDPRFIETEPGVGYRFLSHFRDTNDEAV